MSNTTINHTDTSANGGIPLSQIWERLAMKELCDIAHYLSHGLFINPQDFAERLRQAADTLEDPILERLDTGALPPSSRPEVPIAWIDGQPIYKTNTEPA